MLIKDMEAAGLSYIPVTHLDISTRIIHKTLQIYPASELIEYPSITTRILMLTTIFEPNGWIKTQKVHQSAVIRLMSSVWPSCELSGRVQPSRYHTNPSEALIIIITCPSQPPVTRCHSELGDQQAAQTGSRCPTRVWEKPPLAASHNFTCTTQENVPGALSLIPYLIRITLWWWSRFYDESGN